MTHLVDLHEMTPADLRELASTRAILEDLDAPRAPEPPVVVEDPETASAWERLCQERSDRDPASREREVAHVRPGIIPSDDRARWQILIATKIGTRTLFTPQALESWLAGGAER
jgi:hypothetical protein